MAPQPAPLGRGAGRWWLFPPVPSPQPPADLFHSVPKDFLGLRKETEIQLLQMFPLLCPGNMLSPRPSLPRYYLQTDTSLRAGSSPCLWPWCPVRA